MTKLKQTKVKQPAMLQKLIMDRALGAQASTDPKLLVHLGKQQEQAWITEGLPHRGSI